MNYPQSKQILKKVKEANKILLNCHRGPDPDSIGSALALYRILEDMDKKIDIICPSSEIQNNLHFLENVDKIKKGVDFSKFNFLNYDLLIALDSSSWDMVTGNELVPMPRMPIIVIDHHKTNTRYGEINLVDEKVTSVGELLFLVFEDWGVKIGKEVATALLTGIVSDTGAFRFPGTGAKTLRNAGKLMEKGADKEEVVFHTLGSVDFNLLKFWGHIISKSQVDRKYKFFWSAVPYEEFVECGEIKMGKETAATQFAQIVSGTDFGFIAVEQEKGKLSISFRSRTGFDTSQIALALEGGGHLYASGASIKAPFDQAVEKLLMTCRKFAKKNVKKA